MNNENLLSPTAIAPIQLCNTDTLIFTPHLLIVYCLLISENAFEVSLIDNVYSDMARLRGFYGHVVLEGREVWSA